MTIYPLSIAFLVFLGNYYISGDGDYNCWYHCYFDSHDEGFCIRFKYRKIKIKTNYSKRSIFRDEHIVCVAILVKVNLPLFTP